MISKNFSREEFTCKCGCGYDTVDVELVKVLQEIRDELGPVKITSACRCKYHNAAVGGRPSSQHLLGRAADIQMKVSPAKVRAWLEEHYPDSLGIGAYNTFTHIDTRKGKARW